MEHRPPPITTTGLFFRRAQRRPPKQAAPAAEAATKRALSKLHRLEAAGQCDVLYGDESGFCLQPCLPYLWQKKGQTVGLAAQAHSRRLSVVGFWGRDNQFWSFPTPERLGTEHFLHCHFMASVEALLAQLPRPTVLVLDNSTVHRAKMVEAKRAQWKKAGLRLLFLPPYCPHLNRIEMLWRQVKYRWLGSEVYTDFATLCQSVTNVLDQVGTRYRLSFT